MSSQFTLILYNDEIQPQYSYYKHNSIIHMWMSMNPSSWRTDSSEKEETRVGEEEKAGNNARGSRECGWWPVFELQILMDIPVSKNAAQQAFFSYYIHALNTDSPAAIFQIPQHEWVEFIRVAKLFYFEINAMYMYVMNSLWVRFKINFCLKHIMHAKRCIMHNFLVLLPHLPYHLCYMIDAFISSSEWRLTSVHCWPEVLQIVHSCLLCNYL